MDAKAAKLKALCEMTRSRRAAHRIIHAPDRAVRPERMDDDPPHSSDCPRDGCGGRTRRWRISVRAVAPGGCHPPCGDAENRRHAPSLLLVDEKHRRHAARL